PHREREVQKSSGRDRFRAVLVFVPRVPPLRIRGRRGRARSDLAIRWIFHEIFWLGTVSGFAAIRGRGRDGVGYMGAAEGGHADAEDAALAVADPDLHLGALIGAREDEALADEGLVEGVGAVGPGFAGLAQKGGDSATGGLG